MHTPDVRHIEICKHKGIPITSDSLILDFGCGDGHRVYQLRDMGYRQAFGYNKGDFMDRPNPIKLRQEADAGWFRFSNHDVMPWPDNTFDLILSDQVFEHVHDQQVVFREIHRVLKPGGVAVHVLPAKWQIIEPHLHVPLGGLIPFKRYAWYYFWALLGIRSPYQRGKSASYVAQWNLKYATECLNYLSCRQYAKLLQQFSWTMSWEELAYMQTSYKPRIRQIGQLAAVVPFMVSLIRTFRERVMFLQKATAA
ncbi:MAG: class I SAM-dependent methyltransferase [Nitrospira sp.]